MAKTIPPPNNADDTLRHVARCLDDFHMIDANGQQLRYATDKTGNVVTGKLPSQIEPDKLIPTMKALNNFFEGCDAYVDHLLATKRDMESEVDIW